MLHLVDLIRLTTQNKYRYPLYTLFVISAAVGTVSFFVALLRCKPIDAAWTEEGHCLSQTLIIGFSYGISALNIVIDFSVAIIPIFLLRKTQMKRRLKAVTGFILDLVFCKSAAFVRMMARTGLNPL